MTSWELSISSTGNSICLEKENGPKTAHSPPSVCCEVACWSPGVTQNVGFSRDGRVGPWGQAAAIAEIDMGVLVSQMV